MNSLASFTVKWVKNTAIILTAFLSVALLFVMFGYALTGWIATMFVTAVWGFGWGALAFFGWCLALGLFISGD